MATVSDTTKSITGLFRSLGSVARNTGFLITAASGVAAAALVTLSQRANRVNRAFREVNSITGFVTDSQEKYGELVSELNTEFGLQINQLGVIDGLYQSLSAGIADTEEAQRQFLTTAANLAKVGLVDLETSVDVVSTILNTYGKSADQAENVSRRLFETVQLGKVRLDELAPVMGRVAALGSSMGIEFVELSGAMAQLTRTGFEARVAATGLRNVIRALIKPSDKMQEVLLDIAAEQNFFADSLGSTSDVARTLASDYRSLTDSLDKYNEKQKQARQEQEQLSLQTQRARLAINAIEEDRVDLIDDSVAKQLAQNKSISELNEIIDENRIKISDARVEQENYRQQTEKTKQEIEDLKQRFTEQVDAAGNLEGGIGELFAQNQGLTETLVDLKKRVNETSMSMSDVFPRTRALQAALALVGSEGNNLVTIMDNLRNENFNAAEAFKNLSEETKEGFGDTPEEQLKNFKERTQELSEIETLDELIGGGTGKLRDSLSRVQEAATALGNVFNDQVTNALTAIGNGLSKLTDFLTSLRKSAQNTIAQFTVLAVSLGLIVGPALLVVGVAALLAQALGPALIPIVGGVAAVLAMFVSVLKAVKSQSGESQSIINLLSDAFSGLVGFASMALDIFSRHIGLGLQSFGRGLVDVFNELKSQFSEFAGGEEGVRSTLVGVAIAISSLFRAIGRFLQSNASGIASFFVKLVEVGQELAVFFIGLFDVLATFVTNPLFQGIMKVLIASIMGFLSVTGDVLAFIGKWLSENKQFVATLLDVIIVIASLASAVSAIAGVFSTISSILATASPFWVALLKIYVTLQSVLPPLLTVFSVLGTVIKAIIPGASLLAKAIGFVVTGLKIAIGAIASFLGVSFGVAAGIVAVVAIIIAAIWYFRDEIAAAFMFLIDLFVKRTKSLINTISEVISILFSDLSPKEKGKKIIEAIASGMRERINILKNAAKEAANAVADFLGVSSPAPKGPLSGEGPSGFGKNTTESYASGLLEGKSNITKSVEEATPKKEDFELEETPKVGEEMNTSDMTKAEKRRAVSSGGMPTSTSDSSGREINVNEKAIFFQKGAFQGVSDEELPGKVRKIIDQSTTEIIKDLEAKGVEIEQ